MRTSVVFRVLAVGALSLVVGNAVVGGQRGRRNRVPTASTMLESLKSLKCSFPASASGSWEGREPRAQTSTLAAGAVDAAGHDESDAHAHQASHED